MIRVSNMAWLHLEVPVLHRLIPILITIPRFINHG